jgi:hypothetical protein
VHAHAAEVVTVWEEARIDAEPTAIDVGVELR